MKESIIKGLIVTQFFKLCVIKLVLRRKEGFANYIVVLSNL